MLGRRRSKKDFMSKLAEIIKLGIAPGFNTKTTDPTLPQNAVPRAFKELEQTQSASSIARDSGFSVKKIKKIWNMLAVLTALLATTAQAGDLTRSVTFSDGQRITAGQLHTLVDGASVNATFLTGKNLNSTVETTDYVLVYDTSAGVFTKMTLSTLVMANTGLITTQADDPNPDYNDYVLTYDASASSFAKVSITNLLYNTNLIAVLPNITNLTQSATMWVRHSGTNAQIEVTNLLSNFSYLTYRVPFTNLSRHTTPTNTDRLLIWDSVAGTNKWTGLSGLVTNLPTVTTNGPNDWLMVVTNGNVSKMGYGNLVTNIYTFVTNNNSPFETSARAIISQCLPQTATVATPAFDAINNHLYATNHGFVTGWAVTVQNSTSYASRPTPLNTNTLYFCRSNNSYTLALYTNKSDALAGNANSVVITSAGSATTLICHIKTDSTYNCEVTARSAVGTAANDPGYFQLWFNTPTTSTNYYVQGTAGQRSDVYAPYCAIVRSSIAPVTTNGFVFAFHYAGNAVMADTFARAQVMVWPE